MEDIKYSVLEVLPDPVMEELLNPLEMRFAIEDLAKLMYEDDSLYDDLAVDYCRIVAEYSGCLQQIESFWAKFYQKYAHNITSREALSVKFATRELLVHDHPNRSLQHQ